MKPAQRILIALSAWAHDTFADNSRIVNSSGTQSQNNCMYAIR
jgi:hypothetical protein